MLLLLALAAGTGLVAVVGWSLLRSWQQDRSRQELDARQAAFDVALVLRTTLLNPAIAERLPATTRFRVHAGAVVVPETVGWLVPRPACVLDPVEAGKLLDAERAEFVHRDHELATRIHDELLGPRGPTGTAGLLAWAAAGFHAHRCGDVERVAAIRARLDAALAALPTSELAEPRCADVVAAAVLLHHASEGLAATMPGWMTTLIAALPPALVEPLLHRLGERGALVAEPAAAHAAVAANRATLQQAAAALASFGERPFARAFAGRVLLWWPDGPGHDGDGHGAWIEPQVLASLLPRDVAAEPAAAATGSLATLVFTAPSAGDGHEVVADAAWVVPRPLPPRPWFAGPVAITGATSALLLVCVGSGWLLLRALRREAAAMRARAEFLTGVTHELKTPVASIHLASEVLCEDDVAPHKQAEYHQLLLGESARLMGLIDNVLDLGQLERGERPHDPQPGDLAALVREAVARHRQLLQRAGIELVLRERVDTTPAVFDRGGLLQVLGNLFDNARKYAAAGGRVELSTALDDEGTAFVVEVRDFGPGVPADERDAVFSRFRRGHAHRHGSIPGLGLGLYLARGIVARHGGSLRCTEPPHGKGALFVLRLPLGDGPS